MNNYTGGRQVARRGEGNNSDPEDSGPSWWAVGLGVAAGVTALAGGIYMLSQLEQPREAREQAGVGSDNDDSEDSSDDESSEIEMDYITDAVSRLAVQPTPTPTVTNLNSLLNDIYVRYIAIKKEEFGRRYDVFSKVFGKLHKSMKAVDSYYNRYSSRLRFKPEDFSMNIVIRLPVNVHEDYQNPEESDIIIEPKHASFVQLRAGIHYEKKILSDGANYHINRQVLSWLDERKYILHSKFSSWFQSVVDRALNRLQKSVRIHGTEYKITSSSNSTAYILWITNSAGFRLEVDLIPALRFPENRWLGKSKAYRDIPPDCSVDYWTVIPKPNKFGANTYDEHRSWHLDMYDQEKKFIYNSFHLRQGMRLLKKLRDAQQMGHIEHYHIETLFLWKSLEFSHSFWQRDVATIFKVMLQEFHEALVANKIRFFWKKSHNLIEMVPEHIIKGYARKLATLITQLEDDSNYMVAAEYLLTDSEYTEYKACGGETMSSRDGWVPVVAGVVLGAGLLLALYQLFLAGPKCGKENQTGPCACSCEPGAKNICTIQDHRRRYNHIHG